MAWVAPITFVAGNVLRGAQMNTYVRDNLRWLYDPPMACVYPLIANGQSIPTGSETVLDFAKCGCGLMYDTDSMIERADSDPLSTGFTVPTGDRITANTAGVYYFAGRVEWATGSATGIRRAHIDDLNSTTLAIASDSTVTSGAFSDQSVKGPGLLAAGGYVQLLALQTSGAALTVVAINFSAQWMGSGV